MILPCSYAHESHKCLQKEVFILRTCFSFMSLSSNSYIYRPNLGHLTTEPTAHHNCAFVLGSVLPTSLVAHLSDTGYSPSQVYVFWVYLRVFWRENRKLDFKQQWHHPLRWSLTQSVIVLKGPWLPFLIVPVNSWLFLECFKIITLLKKV